ncbi:hypothetical protein V6Z11_A11G210700 [Gossypium hirsutum]
MILCFSEHRCLSNSRCFHIHRYTICICRSINRCIVHHRSTIVGLFLGKFKIGRITNYPTAVFSFVSFNFAMVTSSCETLLLYHAGRVKGNRIRPNTARVMVPLGLLLHKH